MTLDPTMSGRIAVSDANTLGQITQRSLRMRTDGLFYVYVTSLSARNTYFDKLTIKRWKPQVRVSYDYYPYGLNWKNPDLQDEENRLHDHAYQDKEFMFGEFDGTVGLALYDFSHRDHSYRDRYVAARMYDPATGRWLVPDPAAQFANPYLAMGNNPVIGVDPNGEFVVTAVIAGAVVGAYIGGTLANNTTDPTMWDYKSSKTWAYMGTGALIGAAVGFGYTQGLGMVRIRPDYRFGTEQNGLGFDITVGVNFGPVKLGMRFGMTYYGNSFSGTSGLETRTGLTAGVGKGFEYNLTHFESGETSQTTAMARINVGKFYVKYENDQMPFADKGDRYRSAAQEIGFGPFKMGATMFTGDPDAKFGKELRPSDKINGKEYYESRNGSAPDKYRAGIGYFGIGNFKIGINSESIRHAIQNVLVHDTIGVPRFQQLPDEHPNSFHFSFGSSPYTLY